VLPALGIEPSFTGREMVEWNDFSIIAADEEHPPTANLHVGFVAASREAVAAFWQAGVQAGYRDDGAPGERPEYSSDYYGSFLRDPDEFHAAATGAGYQSNGAPGERPRYHAGYYAGFVLDPNDANVESVYHGRH
jgi:hypothetical protein